MRRGFTVLKRLSLAIVFGAGWVQAATPIAELPLKASILAKPNVIFGMDDSGSMDGELLLYSNDGAFWWNSDSSSGWGVDSAHPNVNMRSITSTWFNSVGTADNTWRKMIYLFPNGTGLGNRVYEDSEDDHFAIMPTRQFAFTRWSGVYRDASGVYRHPPSDPVASPVHNALYYNPLITYKPWAPAHLSTGAVTPAPASPSAAKSHPMYGTATFNLEAAIAASTAADTVFTALPGMRVPGGSRKMVCNSNNESCGGWVNVSADENAAAGSVTRVSMSYWPATYWVKETCTPQNLSQVNDSCTVAPDGSTLRRYEIRAGVTSYPSGRTYADELQNFANWFQYYRKRKMMLAGAMGTTLETLTGMRLGVVAFNDRSGNVTLYDADAASTAQNRSRVAGIFYEANGSGSTPTRETLKYIGEQFKRTDKTGGVYNVIQYACQRNNAFIVTDGFATASAVSMPGWDSGKSANTWGSGAPYATTYTGTLADLALRYYTNNPRPPGGSDGFPAGALPRTATDLNPDLHMNTYGLTIGARGTLFLSASSSPPTLESAWPNPTTNRSPTSVDDLWHATINGRGKMYLATNPEETAATLRAGLDDMLSQRSTQSAVAVSSINLDRGDTRAYQSKYDPAGWSGDIERVSVSASTGAIGHTPSWCASVKINSDNWASRVMASHNGSSGVLFNHSTVGNLVNPGGVYGASAEVLNYLRGDVTHEGSKFRLRKRLKTQTDLLARCGVSPSSVSESAVNLLGAVVNAEPAADRVTGVVYAATGEGMLHALDAETGSELWAYVPGAVLPEIGQTTSRSYAFKTQLDGSPVIRSVGAMRLLVAGLGVSGRAYYALDVTSPKSYNASNLASKVLWEFPAAGDASTKAKVGQAVGRPLIVKLSGNQWGVVVASGYNNNDGIGRVWLLDATTGAILKEYSTAVGTATAEAGLAHLAAMSELDGTVKYVYGGDLLGNLWRFDLSKPVGDATAVQRLAQLKGPTSAVQSVTSVPELALHKTPLGQVRRIVYVGTGRLLDSTDFGASAVQSVYAISDEGASLTPSARSSLVQQVLNPSGSGSLTGGAVNWDTHRGWFVDLPAGDQVNNRPALGFGGLAVVANRTGSNDCAASSRLYVIDALTGGKFADVNFVVSTLSGSANATAPVLVRTNTGEVRALVNFYEKDQSSGHESASVNVSNSRPVQPSKNAWREIRR